jgi:SAM-dependent methyltransferase
MNADSGAADAYNAIAPVYDAFTAEYNTEAWLGELLPALERQGLTGNRLLDVGCGTGESFLPMLARGWHVTGCDVSAAMIERARAKAGDAARLAVADMRELPRFGIFDLVWALDDTINYLLSPHELAATLAGMRNNLAPSGLILFDLNTLRTYRTVFAERHVIERDGLRLVWTGKASPDVDPGSICEAGFEAEGDSEARPHVHRQRHYPEAEVRAALVNAGLECLDVSGHGFDGVLEWPLDETTHTKAVYLARAKLD